jgi:hypothetical protein
MDLTVEERGNEIIAIALVEAVSPVGDAPVPTYLSAFDTRQTFVFESRSGLLRSLLIEGDWKGEFIPLVRIDDVEYLEYDPELFRLDLPEDVIWSKQSPEDGIDRSISGRAGTPEASARAFFEAWIGEDYETMALYCSGFPYPAHLERAREDGHVPVELVHLGTAKRDRDSTYPGLYIPYELLMADGQVKKHRIAMKPLDGGSGWFVDGGI